MLSNIESRAEIFFEKEKPQEFRSFTDHEVKALRNDGAHFIDLTGETIEDEQTAKRLFRYVVTGGDRLLKAFSIKARVAIYTDPKRFFIPNSGNKDLPTQEKLAKKDGRKLRKRLKLEDGGLDVIIPGQASTFTEIILNYLDKTAKENKEVLLFGPDHGYLYGTTKNRVNQEDGISPFVACVGISNLDGGGINVVARHVGFGEDDIRVVRLVVAKKK